MNLWHSISPGDDIPNKINVIIEIPKGSQNKYEYDFENKIFRLDRVLFSPIHYPGDYGIIPQTLAKDGDALDALVLVTYPTYPGMLVEARPIGVLKLIDNEKMDDKILCVPIHDIRLSNHRDITDMEKPILNEIAHFFRVYKQLESKNVEIIGWKNAKTAKLVILQAVKMYKIMLKE